MSNVSCDRRTCIAESVINVKLPSAKPEPNLFLECLVSLRELFWLKTYRRNWRIRQYNPVRSPPRIRRWRKVGGYDPGKALCIRLYSIY